MNLPFTFPAPLDAFIACQEQLINRPLTENEREVTAVWLEIINETTPGTIQTMDELIAQHPDDTWITRFLTAAKEWMEVAWKHETNC